MANYQIIHRYWLQEYLDQRTRYGLKPDVRVVPPGVNGAPALTEEDQCCVVIELPPAKNVLAWNEAILARLNCE